VDGRGTVVDVNLLRQTVRVRMEDAPDQVNCYKNCDICVLRNGKAKKTDPPIPKDLAPISSKPRPAKRFETLPEDEPLPDVIITGKDMPPVKPEPVWEDDDLPAPAFLADVLEKEEKPEGAPKSNRNRRKRKKPAAQAQDAAPKQEISEKPAQKQDKPQKTKQPKGENKPKSDKPKQEQKSKSENKPKADKPKQDRPQKPKAEKSEGKPDAAPKTEGESKPKSNNHHRRRRRPKGPKPEGGAGAPQ